jgi:2-polyprenyl-6-methoxyphenol hydroxylase-like FAD-dependent oxidoreductase
MHTMFERDYAEDLYRTDVLIVGAGPAGLVMAAGLARQGVSSILVEQRSGPSGSPRAAGISPRTMEILRGWCVDDCIRDRALAVATAVDQPLSPSPYVVATERVIEAALLEHLRTYRSDVRFATKLVQLKQDTDGVTSTLRYRTSLGRNLVRSKYIVGADGAYSLVRNRLGIGLRGPREVADAFRLRHALLVGDAAHPSSSTQADGLDLAVQDAQNLAWKLAVVLGGWTRPELLDTYEQERRPVCVEPTVAADLGITYGLGAFVPDDSTDWNSGEHRLQSARPGTRAPHLWLGRGRDQVSTIDLFGDAFVLLTGPQDGAWRHAAALLTEEYGVALCIRAVGGDHGLQDAGREFTPLYGVDDDGAVLVRPDGYVAWRARTAAGVDAVSELRRGLVGALQLADDRRASAVA